MTAHEKIAADKAERSTCAEVVKRALIAAEHLTALYKRGALGDYPAAKKAAEAYDEAAGRLNGKRG